jgi:hypothetical protein
MAKLNWKQCVVNPREYEACASRAVGGRYRIFYHGNRDGFYNANDFSVEYRKERTWHWPWSYIGTAAHEGEARALAQADNDQRLAEIKAARLAAE